MWYRVIGAPDRAPLRDSGMPRAGGNPARPADPTMGATVPSSECGTAGPRRRARYWRAIAAALLIGAPAWIAARVSTAAVSVRPGMVTTVAGYGFVDRAGVDINLASPGLMAVDSSGYVYFTDADNNTVYGRDPWNITDQLAGTGLPGFAGDGGTATDARLNGPRGVATTSASYATDPGAAVYIADTGNHRIRKIEKNKDGVGIITTVAGDGSAVYKGDGGPALQAGFVSPEGLALAPDGTVYVADRLDHRVRKIAPDGTITTLAGTGQPGFSGDGGPASQAHLNEPVALLLDTDGSLYISDRGNNRVRKVAPDGTITTAVGGGASAADGGAGTDLDLHQPEGLAVDADDDLFFTDGLRVRAIMGGKVRTVAGNGQAGWTGDMDSPLKATFRHPLGLAVPENEALLIGDDVERRVRRVTGFTDQDYVETAVGSDIWDDTLATDAKITLPDAVQPMPDGRALIADYGNRRVRSLEPPHSMSLPHQPYFLYTSAGGGDAAPVEGSPAVDAAVAPPMGIAGQVGGPFYFSEGEQARVCRVDQGGEFHTVPIPGLVYPTGLALASDGRLFVADRDAARIWVVDASGKVASFAGSDPGDGGDGGPATSAKLNAPQAVAVGPNGAVYIADTGNHRVRRVDPDGSIHTVAGTGHAGLAEKGPAAASPLSSPEGVAVDSDGTVYIADTMNHRIVRALADGTLEPVAGGPDPGSPTKDPLTGVDLDEWAGTAGFYEPAGIAFDGQGNLYIADRRNHRIRVIWDAAAAQFGPAPAVPGDVNSDGKINVRDAITVLQIAVKSITPTDAETAAADVAPHPGAGGRPYGDGRVDAADAIRILLRALGFIKDDQWP